MLSRFVLRECAPDGGRESHKQANGEAQATTERKGTGAMLES
jgi:hypothetical protein